MVVEKIIQLLGSAFDKCARNIERGCKIKVSQHSVNLR